MKLNDLDICLQASDNFLERHRILSTYNPLNFYCVEQVMNTEVIHAPITTEMLSLLELMSRYQSNYVVIVDQRLEASENGQQANWAPLLIPVGLVTEQDIFKFQMQGLDLAPTPAQSFMSTTLVCISPDEVLWKAYQQMRRRQVRQLLVTGNQGELLGIVTDTAILQALEPAEAYEVTTALQQAVVKQAEILFREKELAEVTLKCMSDAVITTDSLGQVQYLNPAAEQLTGWKTDQVKGLLFSEVFKIVNEVTGKPIKNLVEKVLHSGLSFKWSNHTLLIARDGIEYAIDHSAAPIHNREGEIIGVVLLFHDVTESRNLANQLSWQATHDALTGLFNRREFERQIIEAIDTAKKKNQQHTLCYIDLDQFKVVNDICGHLAGDRLLCQLSALLKKPIRSTDTLARLGGDEFGLLLHRCSLEKGTQVAEILRKLIQDFHFTWQDKTFSLSASMGLFEIDGDTQDLSHLLSCADSACYAAKDQGRNCVYVYQNNDSDLMRQRRDRQWFSRINQALEKNSFCLYSQKIFPLTTDSNTQHYELLLRLRDETGKLVPPMAFIPAAERYDLMPAIDRWVIGSFLTSYQEHYQKKLTREQISSNCLYSINLSGASVNNDQFLSYLQEELLRHPTFPEIICFEITETVAINNLTKAAQFIESLKELGCSFALDDFGSGMSSLTYLKHLPVDYVKIDGSFIKNLVGNQIDYTLVEFIHKISQMMGIKTIAEFVENQDILTQLRALGIDYAQGYALAQPSPITSGSLLFR